MRAARTLCSALSLLLASACAARASAPPPSREGRLPRRTAGSDAALSAPDAAHSPPVEVDPSPEGRARLAYPRVAVERVLAWHVAGASELSAVLGEVPSGPGLGYERGLFWYHPGDPTESLRARLFPLGNLDVVSLAELDVSGDARAELLLFVGARGTPPPPAGTVLVFSLPVGREQPTLLGAESAALDGARDLASVRARLPLSRALTPEELVSASAASLVGRLAFATQAEFARRLGPRFELCSVSLEHPREHSTRACRRVDVARLTAREFTQQIAEPLARALDSLSALGWSCSEEPEPSCEASRNGGLSTELTFQGLGAERRLRRLTETDRNYGE